MLIISPLQPPGEWEQLLSRRRNPHQWSWEWGQGARTGEILQKSDLYLSLNFFLEIKGKITLLNFFQETHPGGAVSLSAAMTRISSQPHALSISTQPGPGPGMSRLSQLPNSYPAPSPLYSPTGSGHQDPNHLPSPSVLSPRFEKWSAN